MPTKITVVDIDLGISVDDIISGHVTELTEQSRQELDKTIELAKIVQEQKKARETQAKTQQEQFETGFAAICDLLLKAADGLTFQEIIDKTGLKVATQSAFTLRFKRYLAINGNKYALIRNKVAGAVRYTLKPFNLDDASS